VVVPSTTIHIFLPVQFTCLTVFFCTTSLQVLFVLPLGLEPSTSYSIHFFTQSLISFCNTCPYYRNLFCCSIEICHLFLVFLSTLYFFHLTVLISLPTEVPYFLSLQARSHFVQHTTLHTTAVQSPSHNQWHILVGKHLYQLPEFIPSNSNTCLATASASPSTLILLPK